MTEETSVAGWCVFVFISWGDILIQFQFVDTVWVSVATFVF